MALENITNSDKKITKDNPAVKITDIQNSRLYRLGIEKGYFILKVNDINVNDINEVDRIDIEALNSILFMSPSGEKERIIFE